MKTTILSFQLFICLLICSNTLQGQIWYKLVLLDDGETYQVSIVPEEDWEFPNNLTSTGQVTIKVPTLEFEIAEFESVNPQLTWEYNARVNAPSESFDLDYLSFGLKSASRSFEYEAGEEIPIIRFKNVMGCSNFVSLLDNVLDPVEVSTTRRANVGNQLTVLGARGNAYVGNQGKSMVKCEKYVKAKETVLQDLVLYPNPAHNEINVKMDWTHKDQASYFLIRDNAGRVVAQKQADLQQGFNEIQFDIGDLDGGMYHIELSNTNQESISLDRFVKIYSASIDPLPGTVEEADEEDPRK